MQSFPSQFDFGDNWQRFSKNALTDKHVERARNEFCDLIAPLDLKGLSFLDIGFGQGLSLLTALDLGAVVVGCDINPKCAEVVAFNRHYFQADLPLPTIIVGSILDGEIVETLRCAGPPKGYDIVHSWGVLHHTGNMRMAISNATSLVARDGLLIIAIYNKHWSSRAWWHIKRQYVASPRHIKRALAYMFYPLIYAAKLLSTKRNPKHQERGMDFYYNVVDWIGGFPYEYAGISEIDKQVAAFGFRLCRSIPAIVPTGCNQFIFRRVSERQSPSCI
jgi:2-polyprenyl-3-methyl-5-hydroxy-6-metoxy-1,4-benzoquinol methylase